MNHDTYCWWTKHPELWDGGNTCDECDRIKLARAEERKHTMVAFLSRLADDGK